MLTKLQAIGAREFHHVTETQNSGRDCLRVRRNGATQTWKTRPAEWRIPVRFGMRARDQFSIHESDAASWNVATECPRCASTGTITRQ